MIKIVKTFICLVLFCFVAGFSQFSDLKQNDEYSCGPVCAANCAVSILNQSLPRDELIQNFTVLSKTDANGTTTENLCIALEKFFEKAKIKTSIKYYGIRKVSAKYKMSRPLDICEELQKGSSVILNLGFYKKEGNVFVRKEGHYVNAYACRENKILIADPYAKDKPPYFISLEKTKRIKIRNTKDSEKYSLKQYGLRNSGYYKVHPRLEYLSEEFTVFLNGIISIYPYYI